jgi:hypothetical protein
VSESTSLGQAKPLRETDKALLVELADPEGEELWVPKAVIHEDSECYSLKGGEGELRVAAWWAKKNGRGE